MVQVINPTPFPEAVFRKLGPGDQEYEVLAVRGTYRFTEDDWPLILADEQRPIRWQATLEGEDDSLFSQVISDDRDVLIGKLGTEVQLRGTLRSPTGQPRQGWQVRVQVGAVDKRLNVHGPRDFHWRLMGGWRITPAEPVSSVPLDYRHAFGGHFRAPGEGEPERTALYYPANPAGRGWLPSRADYKRLPRQEARQFKRELDGLTRVPAPQLEYPEAPATSPYDRPAPAGLGPLAPWWEPRIGYQGTFDADWEALRAPCWPVDFDYRYHHSAPRDLISAGYLRGDEYVILTNCLPGSRAIAIGDHQLFRHRTRLPGIALHALVEHASGERSRTPLALDTVDIDLDQAELSLTWRALFPPRDPLKQVRLRRGPLTDPSSTGGAHVG